MTLNSVIKRIRDNSLAHKQVETFKFGRPTEFLTEKTLPFGAVFLQDNGGNISRSTKTTTLNFRLFVLDLVNVSDEAKDNEQDVMSDCLSIAEDLIAILGHDSWTDWKFSAENEVEFVIEQFGDMVAGVAVDITISFPFTKDVCAVPTTLPLSF
jgi:hypothetical protein